MTNDAMKDLRWNFLNQMDAYINNNCGHGDYLEWKDFFYTNFKAHLFDMVAEDSTLWNDACKFFGELTEEGN